MSSDRLQTAKTFIVYLQYCESFDFRGRKNDRRLAEERWGCGPVEPYLHIGYLNATDNYIIMPDSLMYKLEGAKGMKVIRIRKLNLPESTPIDQSPLLCFTSANDIPPPFFGCRPSTWRSCSRCWSNSSLSPRLPSLCPFGVLPTLSLH
jgi:hypothetical protein